MRKQLFMLLVLVMMGQVAVGAEGHGTSPVKPEYTIPNRWKKPFLVGSIIGLAVLFFRDPVKNRVDDYLLGWRPEFLQDYLKPAAQAGLLGAAAMFCWERNTPTGADISSSKE